ncbi:MAG: rhodanese-like domain-containing protein [Candidatus Auribacterota bacterium]
MAKSVFDEVYGDATISDDDVRMITYEQFMCIRDCGEDYKLLDVLSEESYGQGHIKNSISFPVSDINGETAKQKLNKDDNIIVYCASQYCSASTRAAKKLSELGYKVLDFKGGLEEFQMRGNRLLILF